MSLKPCLVPFGPDFVRYSPKHMFTFDFFKSTNLLHETLSDYTLLSCQLGEG